MYKYAFYSKSDINKELISKKDFNSEEEAVLFWSALKQLNISDFVKIYEVIKLK